MWERGGERSIKWEALRRVREEAAPGEDGVVGKWLKN